MKKYVLLTLIYVVLISCHNESEIEIAPSEPFIKAKVDGAWKVFASLPDDAEPLNYIGINRSYFAITLRKSKKSTETWVITASNVDVDSITLPYTIQGPNPDFTGQSPEVFTTIYDPAVGNYGKFI